MLLSEGKVDQDTTPILHEHVRAADVAVIPSSDVHPAEDIDDINDNLERVTLDEAVSCKQAQGPKHCSGARQVIRMVEEVGRSHDPLC